MLPTFTLVMLRCARRYQIAASVRNTQDLAIRLLKDNL
jgi:hypothetical protein